MSYTLKCYPGLFWWGFLACLDELVWMGGFVVPLWEMPWFLKPQASTSSLVKLMELNLLFVNPLSEHTEGCRWCWGRGKMKAVLAFGKIPAVFAAVPGRKDKVYTWEVDAWQNNKGNGARALHWGGGGGRFRNTEGVTQQKTVSLWVWVKSSFSCFCVNPK